MNFFLVLTILCLIFQAFFAMMEMAIVSFNRVRLQYYLVRGSKKAKWISRMLLDPTRLFATTLVGVNAALQIGSECSRRFYASNGLDPDLAPVTQILLVLLFAELAPLFAARRHPESVAMLGIGPLYLLSYLMRPLTWFLGKLLELIDFFFKKESGHVPFISKEELQKAIEALDEKHAVSEKEEFNHLINAIFSLKSRTPRDFMTPIDEVEMIPTGTRIKDIKRLIRDKNIEHLPVYYHQRHTIVGIISTRNLLKASDDARCDLYMQDGWFVAENESVFKVIEGFRKNGQPIAIVVDATGLSVGVVHLDQILQAMFLSEKELGPHGHIMIDRSFDLYAEIDKVNAQFDLDLPKEYGETLIEFMEEVLKRRPHSSESIRFKNLELIYKEGDFLGDARVHIRTILP
jgi:CBS domain containing-hemolysin-like protein